MQESEQKNDMRLSIHLGLQIRLRIFEMLMFVTELRFQRRGSSATYGDFALAEEIDFTIFFRSTTKSTSITWDLVMLAQRIC